MSAEYSNSFIDNSPYQTILKEGKLCITSAKKLHIGLKCINSSRPCSVIEYDNPTNRSVLELCLLLFIK